MGLLDKTRRQQKQRRGRIVAATPSAVPRGYRRRAARARRRLGLR